MTKMCIKSAPYWHLKKRLLEGAKFAPNLMKTFPNLHHCRNLMQIRCRKGAGTKMHKCFVGLLGCILFCWYFLFIFSQEAKTLTQNEAKKNLKPTVSHKKFGGIYNNCAILT